MVNWSINIISDHSKMLRLLSQPSLPLLSSLPSTSLVAWLLWTVLMLTMSQWTPSSTSYQASENVAQRVDSPPFYFFRPLSPIYTLYHPKLPSFAPPQKRFLFLQSLGRLCKHEEPTLAQPDCTSSFLSLWPSNISLWPSPPLADTLQLTAAFPSSDRWVVNIEWLRSFESTVVSLS